MTAAIQSMPAAAVVTEYPDLSCVLMPLQEGQLLLPSVCVAEIIPWRRFRLRDGAPDWCLGLLAWRGETVPVIRFERLNEPRAVCSARGRCLVVMNRTGDKGRAAFYALAVEGLPRLVQLADADLTDRGHAVGRVESRTVQIGTEIASIPNLALLEQHVESLLAAWEADSGASPGIQTQPQP